jgi:hypothetical protein
VRTQTEKKEDGARTIHGRFEGTCIGGVANEAEMETGGRGRSVGEQMEKVVGEEEHASPETVNEVFEGHFSIGEKRVWLVAAAVDFAETKTEEHHAKEVRELCCSASGEQEIGLEDGIQCHATRRNIHVKQIVSFVAPESEKRMIGNARRVDWCAIACCPPFSNTLAAKEPSDLLPYNFFNLKGK